MRKLCTVNSKNFFKGKLKGDARGLRTVPRTRGSVVLTIVYRRLKIFNTVLILYLFTFVLCELLFVTEGTPSLCNSLVTAKVFTRVTLRIALGVTIMAKLVPAAKIALPFVDCNNATVIVLLTRVKVTLKVSSGVQLGWEKGVCCKEGGGCWTTAGMCECYRDGEGPFYYT